LADYKKPEDLIGEHGLLKQLTKRLIERALEAEMAEHLGHGKHEPVANPAGNARNGRSKKTLKGEFGELPIKIRRDRLASFEPQLVPKHQTRWAGFDDKILGTSFGAHECDTAVTHVSGSNYYLCVWTVTAARSNVSIHRTCTKSRASR